MKNQVCCYFWKQDIILNNIKWTIICIECLNKYIGTDLEPQSIHVG